MLKPAWGLELELLLARFELLRGLVVHAGACLDRETRRSLASINPEQVGLRLDEAGNGEWALFRAGLLYAVNALDDAHAVFQESHSREGSYWHGMMHRREGDFPNALYWVGRAGRISAISEIAGFSPSDFIEDCAAAFRRGEEPPHLLELQRREWEVMMFSSWKRLRHAPAQST
jgi:hypothetical protein